jgi:hypothetical protein
MITMTHLKKRESGTVGRHIKIVINKNTLSLLTIGTKMWKTIVILVMA